MILADSGSFGASCNVWPDPVQVNVHTLQKPIDQEIGRKWIKIVKRNIRFQLVRSIKTRK